MTTTQQSLREQVRLASAAVARARVLLAAGDAIDSKYVNSGLSIEQLKKLQHHLLQNAETRLDGVRASMLQNVGASTLPGLPGAQGGAGGLQEAQLSLAAAWTALAELSTLRGDKDVSIAAYRSAVELAPNDLAANVQLADLLESRHNVTEAKVHAERALRIDPANVAASLALARTLLRTQDFARAESAVLAAAEAPQARVEDRALAWSLAGEARDRRGETSSAFDAFTRGNQLMHRRYAAAQAQNHPAHPANVRALTQFVERTGAKRAPAASFETPAPVFLMGFPRSGTTLLEQVLASHSGVLCLGETEHLFAALSLVLRDGDLFERVNALTARDIETVRAAYRQMVLTDHPEAEGGLIVDKHPLHITILPLINKIFPDAKIIFTARDPRDTVLSCYQQCFGVNVATAQFWELHRAADYFDAVMGLMTACRQTLALDMLQVEYSDVVHDLERQAREVATFLNLPFEPAMLHFHQRAREREITSASARQVIDPIYDRSLARWRRYAPHLAPVLPLLDKWARRLGYEE